MEALHTKQIVPEPRASIPRVECPACGKRTALRKPWCTDHVARMPYVALLIERERPLGLRRKGRDLTA